MMKHEFEALIKREVSDETYNDANALYMALPSLTKEDFCEAWLLDLSMFECGLSARDVAVLAPVWAYVRDYNKGKRALAEAGCAVELPAIHTTQQAKAAQEEVGERLSNMRALMSALDKAGCAKAGDACKLVKALKKAA